MSAFELSWFLKIENQRNCGARPRATLADSLPQIKTALDHSGVVSISRLNHAGAGPQRLQLSTENGSTVVTLSEIGQQHHRAQRSLLENSRFAASGSARKKGRQLVYEVDKIKKSKRLVCSEAETVYQIFAEFFNTGNVSDSHLS